MKNRGLKTSLFGLAALGACFVAVNDARADFGIAVTGRNAGFSFYSGHGHAPRYSRPAYVAPVPVYRRPVRSYGWPSYRHYPPPRRHHHHHHHYYGGRHRDRCRY